MLRNGKTDLFFGVIIMCLFVAGCNRTVDPGDFNASEKALISNALSADGTSFPEGTMRVLTIQDSSDLKVLRDSSVNFSDAALLSEEFASLCSLMIATMTHPSQDGVGIAAPQVGLNRRVVAVQRFDKEQVMIDGKSDHPIEIYPNVRIVWASDSLALGPEGCLSVPDRRGEVLRSQEIIIEYAAAKYLQHEDNQISSMPCKSDCSLSNDGTDTEIVMKRDTVKGFTAVIFQHEIDHLNGILYIDRL